jgi:hypothetical protein
MQPLQTANFVKRGWASIKIALHTNKGYKILFQAINTVQSQLHLIYPKSHPFNSDNKKASAGHLLNGCRYY